LAHQRGEPLKEWPLAFEHLPASDRQVEPFSAVDLGESLHLSALRRPLDFETVALYGLNIDIAFGSERNHALAATLSNLAERFKRPCETGTCLLRELPTGGILCILARIDFAFRNGPGPLVPALLIRPARMHQQNLQLRTEAPIHQNSCARGGSAG
jgi:hypothetical protein